MSPLERLPAQVQARLLLGAPATLRTRLSPAECLARAGRAVDHPSETRGTRPAIGGVRNGEIWLRKRLAYDNPFQTVLTAHPEAAGDGARLACRAGVSPVTIVTLIFILGITLWGGLHSLQDLVRLLMGETLYGRHSRPWNGLIAVPVIFGGAWLLFKYLRSQAAAERAFLIAYLADALEAEIELGEAA